MKTNRRDLAGLGVAAAAATLAVAGATRPVQAQPKMSDSTWELIKKNGQVRMGVFEYPPPPWFRTPTSMFASESGSAVYVNGRNVVPQLLTNTYVTVTRGDVGRTVPLVIVPVPPVRHGGAFVPTYPQPTFAPACVNV